MTHKYQAIYKVPMRPWFEAGASAEILHDIIKENGFEVLLLGGQIAKSAGLFLPELTASLEDLPVSPLIWPAEAIDEAPLLGVARACWQIS